MKNKKLGIFILLTFIYRRKLVAMPKCTYRIYFFTFISVTLLFFFLLFFFFFFILLMSWWRPSVTLLIDFRPISFKNPLHSISMLCDYFSFIHIENNWNIYIYIFSFFGLKNRIKIWKQIYKNFLFFFDVFLVLFYSYFWFFISFKLTIMKEVYMSPKKLLIFRDNIQYRMNFHFSVTIAWKKWHIYLYIFLVKLYKYTYILEKTSSAVSLKPSSWLFGLNISYTFESQRKIEGVKWGVQRFSKISLKLLLHIYHLSHSILYSSSAKKFFFALTFWYPRGSDTRFKINEAHEKRIGFFVVVESRAGRDITKFLRAWEG